MGSSIRPFQIALFAFFAFLALLAVFLLKAYQPSASDEELRYGSQVIVWGTVDQNVMKRHLRSIESEDEAFGVVSYRQVDERIFNDELVNAIAEGRSPDVILMPADQLVTHRAKLFPIPYEQISQRTFRDRYVDAAEVFMRPDGIYALPYAIDPLVLYWNRDLFASNGLAQPPTTWEAVVSQAVPALTQRDSSRNIFQSAIAFGEFSNVTNAKAIILMLALQSGSQMVFETADGYVVGLNETAAGNGDPLEAALSFFTQFSDPSGTLYNWNKALPSDQNAFLAEELALYFGFGSEVSDIAAKNPNLNFDVAPVPQGAAATIKRTYGDVYGLAIPRGATNLQGGYAAMQKMGQQTWANELAVANNMVSPYRSTLAAGSSNPLQHTIIQAALIARSWLDPDPDASYNIFSSMVADVASGRSRTGDAINDAIDRLTVEF